MVRRLTTAELIQFLEVAREDQLAALWFLLAMTGMRPAEALCLRWESLDVPRKLIRVDSQHHGNGEYTVKVGHPGANF